MTKYYRLKKETPIWEEGAILSNEGNSTSYKPIEDIWNRVPGTIGYYESEKIVEAHENSHWFERVYRDSVTGMIFKTSDQLKTLYQIAFTP